MEYRKRVLFLMEERGTTPMTGQEKRLVVQNFAHFQQFSRPGAKSNSFVDTPPTPRREAACVVCARKDWLEHRHKLSLFGEPPAGCSHETLSCEPNDGDSNQPAQHSFQRPLLRFGDTYYLQSPEQVHARLDVDRYASRWPLIPPQE